MHSLPLSLCPEKEPKMAVTLSWLKKDSHFTPWNVYIAFYFRVRHLQVGGYLYRFRPQQCHQELGSFYVPTLLFLVLWLLSSNDLRIAAPAPDITTMSKKHRQEKECHSLTLIHLIKRTKVFPEAFRNSHVGLMGQYYQMITSSCKGGCENEYLAVSPLCS